jgi:putative DNA primase/helicase
MDGDPMVALVDAATVLRPAASPWPDPAPLPDGLPPVPALPTDALPAVLAPWVDDVAERMQCPPDYPAAAAIVAASALIGRRIAIRPRRRDDWTVIPNLWGAIVGRPGALKTPAADEALRPLRAMEAAAAEAHRDALAGADAAAAVERERKKVAAKRMRKALEAEAEADALAIASGGRDAGAAPARRRYLVNDTTVEKLGEILAENPRGVLLFRDELTGFLRALDKDGRESDRAFFLEAWAGNGRFTYDRIGRGTIDIEACCVSVFGTIQPGPLADYLRGAIRGGAGDDGLMQRFQVTVWPDPPATWRNVDRWPDGIAKAALADAFRRLDALDPAALGAERDGDGVPYLRFDGDGQEIFGDWLRELETRLRSGRDHPAFEAHLAKYRSLVPSLALTFHLLGGGAGPVGADPAGMACAIAEYLEGHARRLYGAAINGAAESARRLAARLRAGDLPAEFGSRDVWRPGWAGLATREAAQEAIDLLCDLDWLAAETFTTAGRPRTLYRTNPKVAGMPA